MPSLKISDQFKILEGYVAGFQQPVMIVGFHFPATLSFNPAFLQATMVQLLDAPASLPQPPTNMSTLCEWILIWVHQLQKTKNIAVLETGKIQSVLKSGEQELCCTIFLPYSHPKASYIAFQWVLETINSLLDMHAPEARQQAVAMLTPSRQNVQHALKKFGISGVNTDRILRAAMASNIPFRRLTSDTYIFGEGRQSRWLRSTFTDETGVLSTEFSRLKQVAAHLLASHGLPVAKHHLVNDADEAVKFARKLGYPVVIKPADKDGGVGVHAGLLTDELVRSMFSEASRHSKLILVEKHFSGLDYRLTVLHGQLIKVIQRTPGGVTGDGRQSVRALLTAAASEPNALRRSRERGKPLLTLDREALELLNEVSMTPDSIPEDGRFIPLRRRANGSTGGTTRLITSGIHPDNQKLAERAAEVMRLDIAGIDLLIPDISRSWLESGAIICEVNAQPQLGDTDTPLIYQRLFDALLTDQGRIPVALCLQADARHSAEHYAFATAFAAGSKGLAVAAAGSLRLDGERWSAEGLGYIPAANAALNCREAAQVMLAATADEILLQGVPTARLDLLIAAPLALTALSTPAKLQRLTRWLLPHLQGTLIYAAHDAQAVALAAALPVAQRCLVSSNKEEAALASHLEAGGRAVWLDDANAVRVGTLSSHRQVASEDLPACADTVLMLMLTAIKFKTAD